MSSNNHNNDSVMMTLTDGGEDMDDDSTYTEDDEMSIDSVIADDDENYLNGLKDDFDRLTRPKLPSPHMITVDELRNQLRLHENNRTMAQLLTMPVDSPGRDEDYVAATEFKYIDTIKEVPNGNVLGKHVIVSKAYGNPLHYACHDPDGDFLQCSFCRNIYTLCILRSSFSFHNSRNLSKLTTNFLYHFHGSFSYRLHC